jgi:uncharacterized Zn finger protein
MSDKKITNPRDEEFVVDGKIDVEKLQSVLEGIVKDAAKANKGNKAAGRRFRLATIELGKVSFLAMRKVTPVKSEN